MLGCRRSGAEWRVRGGDAVAGRPFPWLLASKVSQPFQGPYVSIMKGVAHGQVAAGEFQVWTGCPAVGPLPPADLG